MSVRRLYTPAYVAMTGRVLPVGGETAWLPGAIEEARNFNHAADPGDSEVFVAYRDIPVWQRLSENDASDELDRLGESVS